MKLVSAFIMFTALTSQLAVTEDRLRFAVVLYRHGDRTPVKSYPNDPYKDESNWPVGFGQLTPRGKEMQFKLGQYLRQRYGNILGDKYSEKIIYVRSSDVDRTLMSAQSNLAGLFPPVNGQIWNKNLLWQPVPVHTIPVESDYLLTSHYNKCPRLQELVEEVMQSPEMQKINRDNEWLYDYLTEHTGTNITDIVKVDYIYDTLLIEQIYNKTLPDWTKQVFPDKMRHLRDLSFTITTWTHELKRLRSGPIIDNIVETMKGVASNTTDNPDRRMLMYSGHDTSISSLLNALGLFNPPIAPPYASMVMIELIQRENGEHFVTFQYRNDSTRDPYPMTLPGCDFECPIDRLDLLTKPLRPTHWHAECRGERENFSTYVIYSAVGMASLLMVSLVISLIFFIVQKRNLANDPSPRYVSLHQDA